MMSKNRISLVYDQPASGFFTVNDKITGKVYVDASNYVSFEDIQVKLKCDELAPREGHRPRRGMRQARKRNKRIGLVTKLLDIDLNDVNPMYRIDLRTKTYFSTATNASSVSKSTAPTGESVLDPGKHVFPFELVLPESIRNCPPHCPFLYDEDLRFGFIWTLKAVVNRSGLKRKLRATVDVPVIPNLSQPSVNDIAPNYRTVQESVISKAKAKRMFKRKQQLDVTFQYPDGGISQDRMPLCKAIVKAPSCPMTINRIELNVVRQLRMNGVLDPKATVVLVDRYELGSIRVHKIVNGSADLSSLISEFRLKKIIPPPFSGGYVHTQDRLELALSCTLDKGKVQTLTASGATKILAPSGYVNPNYPMPTQYEEPHEPVYEPSLTSNDDQSEYSTQNSYSDNKTQPSSINTGSLDDKKMIDEKQMAEFEYQDEKKSAPQLPKRSKGTVLKKPDSQDDTPPPYSG